MNMNWLKQFTMLLHTKRELVFFLATISTLECSGVDSSISEGNILIYSCSAHVLISKEINCAEQKYMNMSSDLSSWGRHL